MQTNSYIQNTNFTGYYSCAIGKLSKEAQEVAEAGYKTLEGAEKYLSDLQNINCGKYILSNSEKPSKISPVLFAKVDGKEVKMTPYYDGYTLSVSDKHDIDIVSLWGGDVVEFESSKHPLKPSQYEDLSGSLLERVNELLKKFLPVFTKKD